MSLSHSIFLDSPYPSPGATTVSNFLKILFRNNLYKYMYIYVYLSPLVYMMGAYYSYCPTLLFTYYNLDIVP